MRWIAAGVAAGRQRLGRAIHDAGGATQTDIKALASELAGLRREVGGTAYSVHIDPLTARLDAVTARLQALEGRVDALHRLQHETHERLFHAENSVAIDTFTRFLAAVKLPAEPLCR